jgi:hypothetical protein
MRLLRELPMLDNIGIGA